MRAFAQGQLASTATSSPRRSATVGIVTCGKAHFDLLEVFRRLDISLDALAAAGVRIYKVGLAYPLEPTRIDAFADGLDEILVVEEKGAVVESSCATCSTTAAGAAGDRRQARRARPAAGLASSASCGRRG